MALRLNHAARVEPNESTMRSSTVSYLPLITSAGMRWSNPHSATSLRANDNETSSPRKFSLEGAEG